MIQFTLAPVDFAKNKAALDDLERQVAAMGLGFFQKSPPEPRLTLDGGIESFTKNGIVTIANKRAELLKEVAYLNNAELVVVLYACYDAKRRGVAIAIYCHDCAMEWNSWCRHESDGNEPKPPYGPSEQDLRFVVGFLLDGWDRAHMWTKQKIEVPRFDFETPMYFEKTRVPKRMPYAELRRSLSGYTDDKELAMRLALEYAEDRPDKRTARLSDYESCSDDLYITKFKSDYREKILFDRDTFFINGGVI